MRNRNRHVGYASVAVLAAAAIFVTGAAHAAAPIWMPGFPLRAGTAVILMWSPIPGASEYKLMKKVGEEGFKQVYKGPANTFNDPDAPATKTIEYKVIPVVGGKDGDASAVAALKGVEPLKAPVFTGFLPTADSLTVRWASVTSAMFYNLYRAEQRQGPFNLVGSFQQDSYTDTKIAKGKSYYYQVTAVDKNNTESGRSEVLEAQLKVEVQAVEIKEVVKTVVPKGEFFGEELYEFEQPSDIGAMGNGSIYVVERTSIQFCDKDGKYLSRINFDPKWSPPGGSVLDRDGRILLAFLSEKVIRKIDETGKPLQELSYPPLEGGTVNNPNFVAVDGIGNYWIADGVRFQVIKLDPSGKLLAVLGRKSGTYDAKTRKEDDFPGVGKIYYNPHDGMIYAVLGVDAKIKVIDPKTDKVVKTFGGTGQRPDQFQGIGGVAFRKNGNLLILDHLMQVVKEFDKEFAYVATYADVLDKKPPRLSTNFSSGFEYREDLSRFYVLSTLGNRVYIFDIPM